VSSLAAAGTITGSNFVARTTVGSGTSVSAEPVEHSRHIESRQIEQVSPRTATAIYGTIARTAISDKIARTTVRNAIARIATVIVEATTILTKSSERVEIQVAEREPRRTAEIGFSARITVCDNVARTTVCVIAISDTITRTALRRGCKQIAQTTTKSKTGCGVANCVAGVARNYVARITGDDCVTRIAVVGGTNSNSADQSLETGKQVAASYGEPVAGWSTGINARRITGICITLNTQHKGDSKGSH